MLSQSATGSEKGIVNSLTSLHTFRIYCSGSHGPVLLLLHGGGHSAISWAVFTVSLLQQAGSDNIQHSHTALDALPGRLEVEHRHSKTHMRANTLKMAFCWSVCMCLCVRACLCVFVLGGDLQQDSLQSGGYGPQGPR